MASTEKKKVFTLSIFTENQVGLVNQISIILTRRKINIDSLTTSESEASGIYRFTIVITITRRSVENIVKQIEKVIDVIKVYVYEDHEIIYKEIALYKIEKESIQDFTKLEQVIGSNNAKISHLQKDYIVIEKTGTKLEVQQLLEDLAPFHIVGFVQSGRVAISRKMQDIRSYLKLL